MELNIHLIHPTLFIMEEKRSPAERKMLCHLLANGRPMVGQGLVSGRAMVGQWLAMVHGPWTMMVHGPWLVHDPAVWCYMATMDTDALQIGKIRRRVRFVPSLWQMAVTTTRCHHVQINTLEQLRASICRYLSLET